MVDIHKKMEKSVAVWREIYKHLEEPRPLKEEFFLGASRALVHGDEVGIKVAAVAAAAAIRSGGIEASEVFAYPPPGLPEELRLHFQDQARSKRSEDRIVTAESILSTLLGK